MTQKAFVIGLPAKHSRSPYIHNAAYAALEFDAHYEALDVEPHELKATLAAMREANVLGCNVTMPHKTASMELVDEVSDRAARLNTLNTVVNRNGTLFGDSTDGEGFVTSLAVDANCDVAGKRFLVVGAGGAARAVVDALQEHGAKEIVVVNRNHDNAVRTAQLGGSAARVGTFSDSATVDVVVNATPVGMKGVEQEWPELLRLARSLDTNQLAADLIYVPESTPFLQAAGAGGAKTLGGLGMLIYQAAAAFKLMTGLSAPVEVMRKAALFP